MFVARTSSIFFLTSVSCIAINPQLVEESFRQCLVSPPPVDLGHCLGVGAISQLRSLDNQPEFDLVDGLTLTRNQQQYRDVHNFAETDPANFRTLVTSLGHVLSQRSLRWDMEFVYPGLALQVAPSDPTGAIIEFVLDPQREVMNAHSLKEIGTGRLLARQFLLPFLLGFKFNMSTMLPLVFGFLALLAKKALVLSKIALIISSAYGLGALMLGNEDNKYQQTLYRPGFGAHYNSYVNSNEQPEVLYRGINVNQQNDADQFQLHESFQEAYAKGDVQEKDRNFAWSEEEKLKRHQ